MTVSCVVSGFDVAVEASSLAMVAQIRNRAVAKAQSLGFVDSRRTADEFDVRDAKGYLLAPTDIVSSLLQPLYVNLPVGWGG